jgi:hypothetical protein
MRALTGETEFHLMWQRPRQPEAGPLLPQSGWPVGTLLAQRGVDRHGQLPRLTWQTAGGRDRDRTYDRWCVKPELYH